jgi:hypothetical protein
VWFWESGKAAQEPGAQPNAAIVVFVHHDEMVNLTVFNDDGYLGAYTYVPLWQGEGERQEGRHCEWMPYQKGQAAKSDAEKEAAKPQSPSVPPPVSPPTV